jgi:hypothetical protein
MSIIVTFSHPECILLFTFSRFGSSLLFMPYFCFCFKIFDSLLPVAKELSPGLPVVAGRL